MASDLIIRGPRPEDVPFVVQTYVRRAHRALYPSERAGLPWDRIAERFVARCLEDGACRIAAWRDSDIILGYALGHRDSADRAILHWLHVKELYRRRGIARRRFARFAPRLEPDIDIAGVIKDIAI